MILKNESKMCDYKNHCQLKGISTSLADNPCISVCNLTYGTGSRCICGRTQDQISNWNNFSSLEKKEIVMDILADSLSYPRQKVTFLAEECNIDYHVAKKLFVVNS